MQAANEISEVYGDDAVLIRKAQKWFDHFRYENFDVNAAPSYH